MKNIDNLRQDEDKYPISQEKHESEIEKSSCFNKSAQLDHQNPEKSAEYNLSY